MTTQLTRSDFIRRTSVAGGAALAAGATLGWVAGPAAGAASELDLAWVRFAITAEYVSADYYRQARQSGFFSGDEARTLERCTAAQLAHYRQFRLTLQENNQAPIEAADLEVVFPLGAFETRAGAISLGRRVGGLVLHAYLGAVTSVRDEGTRKVFAQVAASEAEQVAYLTALVGQVITDPFPSVHGLATAADELARYLP